MSSQFDSFVLFYLLLVFSEEIAKKNGDLDTLADNFREQAAKLVDMLDISIPVVAKLKVTFTMAK